MSRPKVTLPLDLQKVYKIDEVNKPFKLSTTTGRRSYGNTMQVYVVITDADGRESISAIEVTPYEYYMLKIELVKWDE